MSVTFMYTYYVYVVKVYRCRLCYDILRSTPYYYAGYFEGTRFLIIMFYDLR